MKVSELSERAGVPLPTIKFYIREGLLPAGHATQKNQAEYTEEHLQRLALIRSLREDAGLALTSIARSLRASDAAKEDFVQAAVDAIERPLGPLVSARPKELAAAKAEILRVVQERGWKVVGDESSLGDAARALAIVRRAFPYEAANELGPYAEAVELLAVHEIPERWAPFEAPGAALRYSMLGTVLFEPFLLALRRLAHISRARSNKDLPSVPADKGQKAAPHAKQADARTKQIYAVVRSIPAGRVATYGQIAELAGIHAGHRLVARAMRSCPEGLPWQRVVAKKDARRAQIAIEDPEHAALQRKLLEAEAVRFDQSGYIVLRSFGWLPAEPPSKPRRSR